MQGLVGLCYNKGIIVYDDDLEHTNESDYNLTDYQKSKTRNLKFCLCIPILSKSDKVIAIMSLDSNHNIKISGKNKDEISTMCYNFGMTFQEELPELFK